MTEQLPDLPDRGRKPAASDAEMLDRLAPDPTMPPSEFEERTSTASYAVPMSMVYMVVMPEGGLFGIFYDHDRARGAAKAIGGTMVELPILEDYRADLEDR